MADDAAARPVVHDEAFTIDGTLDGAPRGLAGGRGGNGRLAKAMPPPPPPPAAAPAPQMMMATGNVAVDRLEVSQSTIVASASAGELGELFEYRIAQPVTIRKDDSAMLPFLQQAIDSRKLLIYSDHSSQHPTNAAELTNSTGKTLDGGPITVYDDGAYGGEAPHGNPQGRRQATHQLCRRPGHAHYRSVRQQGRCRARDPRQPRHDDREAGHGRDANVHHSERRSEGQDADPGASAAQGYTLLNQKPAEKTAAAYRFEIPLAADKSQEFAVNEERVFDQSYQVTSVTPDFLAAYIQNRYPERRRTPPTATHLRPEVADCRERSRRGRQSQPDSRPFGGRRSHPAEHQQPEQCEQSSNNWCRATPNSSTSTSSNWPRCATASRVEQEAERATIGAESVDRRPLL
ncbi:MAG: hypothetical protein WDO73_12515 [Ignavibacteriota bacterium]